MKKLLSILLTLTLVLSMSTAVFATTTAPSITKTYEVKNGTAPAETFTYTFAGVSWTDNEGTESTTGVPAIAAVTFDYDATAKEMTEALGINLADYALGNYKYTVTETAGTTAGVTYSSETLDMTLTVYLGEDGNKTCSVIFKNVAGNKVDGLTNTYDSGFLTVTKTITGNMADMNKKFDFTITLTPASGKQIKSTIGSNSTAGTGVLADGAYTYTISLGNGESVTLSNIPAGVTYSVSEEAGAYTSTITGDKSGTITGGETASVSFNNDLTKDVPTGVSLDSLPYILLLAVVCVGLFGFLSKKRMMHR